MGNDLNMTVEINWILALESTRKGTACNSIKIEAFALQLK
jgi:hypothetical protein